SVRSTATMRPPSIATSAVRAGAPVPSQTVPPRSTRSITADMRSSPATAAGRPASSQARARLHAGPVVYSREEVDFDDVAGSDPSPPPLARGGAARRAPGPRAYAAEALAASGARQVAAGPASRRSARRPRSGRARTPARAAADQARPDGGVAVRVLS